MKIESLKIHNYKVFRNVEIRDIPNLAVFLGKNGTGKTTFFDIFGFLHDCLNSNVRTALAKRGGYKEVVSREQTGDIEFAIKFRPADDEPLITYEISIGLDETGRAVVKKEILRFRRGQKGSPWKVLDFSMGEGIAAKGKLSSYEDVNLATREPQKLDSPDILAIKGLGQFKEFEAVSKFLYDNHPDIFNDIIEKMKQRVPGVEYVEAQETQDGYIVLRFQDGTFKNPFSSKYVSDGTIKMFTYLVLLHDPTQHALLCVEEPENQLYPQLLVELAEEFRVYADKGGQVFVSTHSSDFLNAVQLDEIYCFRKDNGFTTICKASDNTLIKSLYEAGELPGALWKQGLLMEV